MQEDFAFVVIHIYEAIIRNCIHVFKYILELFAQLLNIRNSQVELFTLKKTWIHIFINVHRKEGSHKISSQIYSWMDKQEYL